MPDRILIVDDEPNILLSFSALLEDEGYLTVTTASAEDAVKLCSRQQFDLVMLDLQLPGMSGLDMLKRLKSDLSAPLVLVISGQADIPMALEAVRLGAVDFLEKPVPPEKLITGVRSALMLVAAHRQRNLLIDDIEQRSQIIGNSPAIKTLLRTIDMVAPTDTNVLITGENGTGKELVATRLFLRSNRRDRPFVKVNCPGIPETLFESELFGHVKGAFTGAVNDYAGKFALADGGTIFLDEIGDLPMSCQAKLLRVLESGEVETLGSGNSRSVDTRVICATNRDLGKLVADGKFRQDLFFRISVFVVEVPPLSDRRDDIPLLAGEFLRRLSATERTILSADALAYLSTVDYPGNVRQLKNIIERLTILHPDRAIHLPDVSNQIGIAESTDESRTPDTSLADRLTLYEKSLIAATLDQCQGNISEAARLLQVNRANLSKKIKDLGLKKT